MIYFVSEQGSHSGPVKIGFTSIGARKRMLELQTSHWATLEVLATMDGDESTERELHERFAHARIRGEWFRRAPDLMRLIADARGDSAGELQGVAANDDTDARYDEFVRRSASRETRRACVDRSVARRLLR